MFMKLSNSNFLWKSNKFFSSLTYDALVLGAGPGGYVAAIRSAQLGLKTALLDPRGVPGGTCLNEGCIPSKFLLNVSKKFYDVKNKNKTWGINCSNVDLDLDTTHEKKNNIISQLQNGINTLFKKNNIDFIHSSGRFLNMNTIQLTQNYSNLSHINANNIIIATGSVSANLSGVDYQIDEKNIVTNRGALSFTSIPKHLVVVGGGVIGLELGTLWNKLGSKVTIIEYMNNLLPSFDEDIRNSFIKECLNKSNFTVYTGSNIEKILNLSESEIKITFKSQNIINNITCDKLLISVGRIPYTESLSLHNINVEVNKKGRIPVNPKTFLVEGCKNIYAIGDVIEGPMLAHKAEDEGFAVAEIIAGVRKGYIDYSAIPSVIYTHPEVSGVGHSEHYLKLHNIPYTKGVFHMAANSRAKAIDEAYGFVKILQNSQTKELLGAWIVSHNASELIHELCIAYEYKASAEDIARISHAHPTLSESIKEAANIIAYGKTIHK